MLVERIFDAADALLIHVGVPQHVRRELALRINAAVLLLKKNAAQIHFLDSLHGFRRKFARQSDRSVRFADFRFDFVGRRIAQDAREQPPHHFRVA